MMQIIPGWLGFGDVAFSFSKLLILNQLKMEEPEAQVGLVFPNPMAVRRGRGETRDTAVFGACSALVAPGKAMRAVRRWLVT